MYKVFLPTITLPYIPIQKASSKNVLCYIQIKKHRKIGGAYWMAKITFVVKELNKPSQLALSNLSHMVYTILDTCNDNNKNIATKQINSVNADKMEKTA